jgi:hypothetical protein
MWLQYIHNNIRETGERYSLVNETGLGRRRSAMSFDRVEGL